MLGNRKLRTKTIKSYITGVRSAHIDMGYEDLAMFHNPQLERIVAGMRRLRGEAEARPERNPITKDILLRLLPLFDPRTLHGATMKAAFCLAFAAFLRVGEFTYTERDLEDEDFAEWFLTRKSVKLYEDHLKLTLPSSKTDPFRQGVTLNVAATNDDACAVRALRQLFRRFPSHRDAPLFQNSPHLAFTRNVVINTLEGTLRHIGQTGHYSGHSFRRGAATEARQAGLSDSEIMILKRWKSDAFRLYVVTHLSHILAVSRRHQNNSVPFDYD